MSEKSPVSDRRCRVRLNWTTARAVAHAADLNKRTIPQEVDYALGFYYARLRAREPKYRI